MSQVLILVDKQLNIKGVFRVQGQNFVRNATPFALLAEAHVVAYLPLTCSSGRAVGA